MRSIVRVVPLVLLAASATVAVVGACSSFSDDTPANGAEGGSVLDDAAAARDDAATSPEGDAAAAVDATRPVRPCPALALLCDSFERSGAAVLGPWTEVGVTPQSVALTIDPARASTGSASLRADDRDGGGIGLLRYALDTDGVVPAIDLDLLVDALPPVGANLLQVVFGNRTVVNVSLDPDGFRISTQSADGTSYVASPPRTYTQLGVWNRFHFEVSDTLGIATFASTTASPAISITHALPNGSTPFASSVTLGLPFVSPHDAAAPFSVWFDDITITP